MAFEFLATELVANIYQHCAVEDVLALSSTCQRFRGIYLSRKLPILEAAAEEQYGPLIDATQLLTYNASQPAHTIRTAPFSIALLKQILHAGRTAEKWADIYPFKKWKHNFEDRRLLLPHERYRFRRALYRLWLYSRAFHNSRYPRETRVQLPTVCQRSLLLHNWSTCELCEIADVYAVMRDVIDANVCPSNGTIARKFKKRFPDKDQNNQLLFNIHLNYPPPAPSSFPSSPFHSSPNPGDMSGFHSDLPDFHGNNRLHFFKYKSTPLHEPGAEGWGDDIPQYYVVEDMCKLEPDQVLYLKEHAPLKRQVEGCVRSLGDWFENNGQTWTHTLQKVLFDRGEEMDRVMQAIEDGELGVAVVEEV
ncbi:hypothetical protein HDK77DRAFT_135408 [Phyllosticta capitalensis]|uniref:F-box domain-containing protein n=1 Tax=Phyllosticta capitalensis TaxID=121624 RepID=A0ABR1Z2B7_9PEZI